MLVGSESEEFLRVMTNLSVGFGWLKNKIFLSLLWWFITAHGVTGGSNPDRGLSDKEPDPRDLLQSAAQARHNIISGEMAFELLVYSFERPLDGTNRVTLKITFNDGKERFEQSEREYHYKAVGGEAADTAAAKIRELGLSQEAACRAGFLEGFDAHSVTTYDGTRLFRYSEKDGKAQETVVDDPAKGSVTSIFDPRVLGLAPFPSVTQTIEDCLGAHAASVYLSGNEMTDGRSTWHIHVVFQSPDTSGSRTNHFWIEDRHPYRVVKVVVNGDMGTSEFDDNNPEDPIPVKMRTTLYRKGSPSMEQRFTRTSARFDAPAGPASWTLAGLGMNAGTIITDLRIRRHIGYWNGTGLSENPVEVPHEGETRGKTLPNPADLLTLAEKDPKSPLACDAAVWVILNTPDGPDVEEAAGMVLENHVTSESLAPLVQGLQCSDHRCATRLLESVLEKNPNPVVQAQACFSLAERAKGNAIDKVNEKAAVEAEQLFERFLSNYAQIECADSLGRSLADRVRRDLSELRRLRVRKLAPEIEGESLDGIKMKLSDNRGKVVVLTFWATWCAPCIQMIGQERKLMERLAGKPFALVGVNSDSDMTRVKEMLKKEKIIWPSFRDGGPHGAIATTWNVHDWPAVYVLDRNGVIRYRDVREKALADAVDALLAEN